MPNNEYSWDNYLKYAPYNSERTSNIHDITPDEFFNELYAGPRNASIEEDLHDELLNYESSKLLVITGYAGCGKSVFIQRLLQRLGVNFSNRNNIIELFDFEAPPELLPIRVNRTVINKIARGIANQITNACIDNRSYIYGFKKLISNCINISNFAECSSLEDEIYRIRDFCDKLRLLILNSRRNYKRERLFGYIKTELIGNIKNVDTDVGFTNEMKFLLTTDYIWRVFLYKQQNGNNEILYIVYDNLDLIDFNHQALYTLASCVLAIIRDIDSFCRQMYNTIAPLRIIITARKISYSVLYGGIALHRNEIAGIYRNQDISDIYLYTDIIKKRVSFMEKRIEQKRPLKLISASVDYLYIINKLCKIGFINTKYKMMYNYNYRECVEQLLYIKQNVNNIALNIAQALVQAQPLIDTAPDDNEYDYKTHSGASSLFIRAILDDYKSVNLFDEYHLVDILKRADENDKLTIDQLTSLARILLTYLYHEQSIDKKITLNQIFDFFENVYDAGSILTMINTLSRKLQRWRRLIYVKSINLQQSRATSVVDALNNMKDTYLHDKRQNNVIYENDYAEIEICDAGIVYVDHISTHFEFFSLRSKNTKPLFSLTDTNKSAAINKNGEKEFAFEPVINKVITSVNLCIDRLKLFNERVMNIKGYKDMQQYYDSPFVGKTTSGFQQFHEERIIFQHIYHIEDYRRYMLGVGASLCSNDILVEINKKLTSYIETYMNMFSKIEYLGEYREDIKRQLNACIAKIKAGGYKDFKILIKAENK